MLEASGLTKQPSVSAAEWLPDVLHLTHSCDSPGKLKEPGLQKNLGLPLSSGGWCGLRYDVAVHLAFWISCS